MTMLHALWRNRWVRMVIFFVTTALVPYATYFGGLSALSILPAGSADSTTPLILWLWAGFAVLCWSALYILAFRAFKQFGAALYLTFSLPYLCAWGLLFLGAVTGN